MTNAGPVPTVVAMTAEHSAAVLAIYQSGLDTGDASFETVAPPWAEFDAAHLPEHRFVAVDSAGRVLGWVTLAAVSTRCVYAGVAELSVYIAPGERGVVSVVSSFGPRSNPRRPRASGPWRRGSSRRTLRAWRCTGPRAFGWSDGANGSAATAGGGGTPCSSNGGSGSSDRGDQGCAVPRVVRAEW